MNLPFVNYRFLARLRAMESPLETQRRAIVIATARAFLAFASLLAIYLDPTEPARYASLAYGLMTFYALFSATVLVVLRRVTNPLAFPQLLVHGTDLLWASCIILFTEGPNSPFFLFYSFVLLAAAYRWSSRETMITGGVAFLLMWFEAGVLRRSIGLLEGEFELNRLIMRTTYILMMAALMGYLADEDKLIRGESMFVSRTLARIQGESGLFHALSATLDGFASLYSCRSALLVARDLESGRVYLWERTRAEDGSWLPLRLEEVSPSLAQTFWNPSLPERLYLTASGGHAFRTAGWREGRRAEVPDVSLPAWPSLTNANNILWTHVPFSDDWQGRLLLIDPEMAFWESQSRFLLSAAQQIAPALHSLYLIRRLRARASALERARVARELHDGVIQSLLSLELQVDVVRQQASSASASIAADLLAIQSQIHQQVVEVRELMEQMKPTLGDPRDFLESMASIVERFGRESGIPTSFVSSLQEVKLRPGVGRELSRILSEALVNARKHSGASQVVVRFSAANGDWVLEVDDNGRGFDFSGAMKLDQLVAARKGPLVIRERVQSLGGNLRIESTPGKGARVQILIPQSRHA